MKKHLFALALIAVTSGALSSATALGMKRASTIGPAGPIPTALVSTWMVSAVVGAVGPKPPMSLVGA